KLEDGAAEFHLEIKLDSQNEVAWLGLANLQLAKGEATAALESLAKIWEISPEFLVAHRALPSIELPQDSASASISRVQSEAENPAKHFLLAGLYAAANENALSDRQWKSFQADFSAWRQAPNPSAGAHANQDPCKDLRYYRCTDSLQMRKHLTDSERLLLGKTHFALQQFELAADALAQVQGVTNENAEASYWLERAGESSGAGSLARARALSPGTALRSKSRERKGTAVSAARFTASTGFD